MLTLFVLLAVAGGVFRLILEWQLKKRWGITIGISPALAGGCPRGTGRTAGVPKALPLPSAARCHHRSAPARPSGAKGLRCGYRIYDRGTWLS